MYQSHIFKIFIIAYLLIASPAQADQMTDLLNEDRDVCFERSYSPQHMAKHPDQTVTFIRFAHLPSISNDKENGIEHEKGRKFTPGADIEVRFRGGSQLYGNNLICFMNEASPLCAVECDGGQFKFRFKKNNSMLIDFRKTGYMALESDCGEGNEANFRSLGKAKDDKLFRLDPVDPNQCIPSIKARHDRWKAKLD